MEKYCMIEVAFGKKEEACEAIEKLLEKNLVSSCQMVESDSKWRWQGKIEQGKEYLVFMKTRLSRKQEIYHCIKTIHSYECFEMAILNLESCNDEYLDWIQKETKGKVV